VPYINVLKEHFQKGDQLAGKAKGISPFTLPAWHDLGRYISERFFYLKGVVIEK